MESDGLAGSIIILAVVLIKAFFTASEAAITEISDSKVKSFENGSNSEKRLFYLLKKPAGLITAFSVSRIFSAVITAYLAAAYYFLPLSEWLARISGETQSVFWPDIVSLAVIILATVLIMTVFCDGLPKRIVNTRNIDRFAVLAALPVRCLVIILTPITALSTLLINLTARLFGQSVSSEKDVVTEEEILMMVDAGNETGVIEESQCQMINNVFDFNDLCVSEVMTHRTDVVAVSSDAEVSEIVNASIGSGFSRIPVYNESIDHIIGIICVKDLLCMVGTDSSADVKAKNFLRDIDYVPESFLCSGMFAQFTSKKMQMAVVVDEYGGTAGIVTMEDIVESIVGNIQDEYDDEADEIVRISENTYTIDGTAEPEHILEQLGITLPEDNDFDTISGFIVNLLGRIPGENESPSVKYENVLFTVLITEDMCITKVKATVLDENENDQDINTKEKNKDDIEEKN